MNTRKYIIILIAAFSFAAHVSAQCSAENTAFNAGEELTYNLFFNWKFVWVNAGSATMKVTQTRWEGKPGYKAFLITRTSPRLDRFFLMRDTIQCIVTEDLTPRYYKKGANEGGHYYVDEAWYSYPGGKTHLRQRFQNRNGVVTEKTYDSSKCIYDMMSLLLRARSFDVDNMTKGEKIRVPLTSGDKVEDITLIYRGRDNFKMKSTGVTYRCLVFSFVEYPKGKEKEVITFYVTDDENHIPVRLDLFLRFGVAKAYINKSKGLRH